MTRGHKIVLGAGQTEPRHVAIFIDGSNLLYGLRDTFSRESKLPHEWLNHINMQAMLEWLANGREYSGHVHFFTGYISLVCLDAMQLQRNLETLGVHVWLRRIYKTAGEFKHDGLDVLLAVKAMELMEKYDDFLLVSGDSDFMPLLELLHEKGKRVEVASFRCNLCATYESMSYIHRVIKLDFWAKNNMEV